MCTRHDFFPLFVDTRGKKVLVFGAGKIATRRIGTLLKFKFKVKVIGRTPTEELLDWAKAGLVDFKRREITKRDIDQISEDLFLVVAATSSRELNKAIGIRCDRMGVYHSVADSKEECNVFFPAVRTCREVVVGIAGDGSDHNRTRMIADLIGESLENPEKI
ncbi:MAG: NAD(P)-dependent oxidoreductase [Clostridiales bacterium]|nr:NAD(P)-dependent oxidoreductase [Clostridiales bacterium]